MKKFSFLLYSASLLLLTYSCTEDITDELASSMDKGYPRLVVDGSITSDTTAHLVRLARTTDYFSNKPLEPITNAKVTISNGVVVYSLAENPDKPGDYYTNPDVYGIPGNTYTLSVSNVDVDKNGEFETYTASSVMNKMAPVDSISVVNVHKYFMDLYEIRFNADEPGDTKDFYIFRVKKNGVLLTDTITEMQFTDDQFFNGIYVENQPVYNLFPDKTDEHLKINDTIMLETCSVPKEYYDFLVDIMLESHGSDPFGGQPANVRTNVEDKSKATGYFLAYDIKRNMTIVRDTIKATK